MGKASRKKNKPQHDVADLYAEGTCTRCAKRPRKQGHGMWCAMCVSQARMRRDQRRARPLPRPQLIAMLRAMETELARKDEAAA